MYYYFAQFLPDEENPEILNVSFPDLPGCTTFGTGMQEAFESARDALEGYLEVEIDRGEVIPEASDYTTAKIKAELSCQELEITIPEGTLYQLVPADPKAEQPVRLNISMQPRILALIDRTAKEEGMTRSGFLAVAAKAYVNSMNA